MFTINQEKFSFAGWRYKLYYADCERKVSCTFVLGRRISSYHESRRIIWKDRGFAPNPDASDRTFSLDTLPQEYPQTGNGDFRNPAYGIRQENGSRISNLEYIGYEISDGKPKPGPACK